MLRRFAILVVLVAGSCGGNSDTSTGGRSVPLDQLPVARARTVCAQNLKCCSAEEIKGRTQKECEDTISGNWSVLVISLQASAQTGRFAYHPDKMGQCLDAEAAWSCDEWRKGADLNPPSACQEAFEGKVDVGGACSQDLECKSQHCEGAQMGGQGGATDGKCVATISAGGSCAAAKNACVDGTYCDGEKCVTKMPQGGTCEIDDQCQSDSCENGKCVAPSCYVECSISARPTAGACALSVMFLALGAALARRRTRAR